MYVNLHCHTEYSTLDGLAKIKDYINRCRDLKIPALSITDHGNVGGLLDVYLKCKKNNIVPILGMEAYLVDNLESMFSRKIQKKNHLLLIAKNLKGYQNLLKISTDSNIHGFYYKPTVDYDILRKYGDGIIASSACIAGEIPEAILNKDLNKAELLLKNYLGIFGDNFYLEMMPSRDDRQKEVNLGLAYLSRKHGIKTIITNDSHYIKQEDAKVHEILKCIQMNKKYDPNNMRFGVDDYFIMDEDQIRSYFNKYHPEISEDLINNSFKNIEDIVSGYNIEIPLNQILLPKFKIEDENFLKQKEKYVNKYDFIKNELDGFLLYLCSKNWKKYGFKENIYKERLLYELKVICNMGYSSYFLIVWDYIKWAKDRDIMVGPGRGSGAGSLISYILDITTVDPIKLDLTFERFLNPDRVSMPDIDSDFQDNRREEVIDYICKKYGERNSCNITNYNKMNARGVIRKVSSAYNLDFQDVSKYIKIIESSYDIKLLSIRDIFKDLNKNKWKIFDGFGDVDKIKEIFKVSSVMEGVISNDSIHAGGICISDEDLSNYTALKRSKKKDNKDVNMISTQYDKDTLKEIGLLKFDILGVSYLNVIKNTINLIKERYNKDIILEDISLDDNNIYRDLSIGKTIAIFQLENNVPKGVLKKIKANCFEDVVITNALIRPGPLSNQMDTMYAENKEDPSRIKYDHPIMSKVLGKTHGVIAYQEQVMEMSKVLAGFNNIQADTLRKGMGDKNIEYFNKLKIEFIDGCKNKNNIDNNISNKIWDIIIRFAGYSFNRSHCVCYSLLSCWCAWLKYYYPLEYMLSCLQIQGGDRYEILMKESKRIGINILAPNINHSQESCSIYNNSLLAGFDIIKGIRTQDVKILINNRTYKDFKDIVLKTNKYKIGRQCIISLLRLGIIPKNMIEDEYSVKSIVENIDDYIKYVVNSKYSLFETVSGIPKIEEYLDKEIEDFEEKSYTSNIFARSLMDKVEIINKKRSFQYEDWENIKDGKEVIIGGKISKLVIKQDKRGGRYCNFEITIPGVDEKYKIRVFSNMYSIYENLIKMDTFIMIKGNVNISEEWHFKGIIANKIGLLEK